jgi:hypothetical protein
LAGTNHDYIEPIAHRSSIFLCAPDRNDGRDVSASGMR